MRIEELFSSKKLFIAALLFIVGTGLTLIIKLELFNEPVIVPTNIESTFEESEPAPPTEQESAAVQEPVVEPIAEAQADSVLGNTSTTQQLPKTLSCIDCTYAAVDKQNSLPSTYSPSVVATGLTGGGSLTPKAKGALTKLFSAASSASINLEIISSYRSYATQQQTFNYWVSTEVAKGLTQLEAETEANTYSARPGQSEHQLGTTADIKCAGCADFNAIENAIAYDFIAKNAHKYGFAISYPEGQDALTGYTFEPWHIRWIGVDLATELFNTGYISGNGNYLAAFLREKNLSN